MANRHTAEGTGALGGPRPEQVLPQKDRSPWRTNVRAQEKREKEGAAQRNSFIPGTHPHRSFAPPLASPKG